METKEIKDQRSEGGYALVGLMAVMLFALILTTAAAPAIKHESQREREEEMLWRGQQIQNALLRYTALRRNQYPTNLGDLVEGVSDGVKKVRLLRPSALCDPMTKCEPGESNWTLVHPGDSLPNELLNALMSQQQQQQMQGGPMIMIPPELKRFAQMGAVQLPGQEGSGETQSGSNAAPPAGSSNSFGNSSGNTRLFNSGSGPGSSAGFDSSNQKPIIGVVSSKSDQMFRSYYGIDAYDHALFFPGVPVVAGGFNRAALAPPLGAKANAAAGGVPGAAAGGCRPGEILVGGQCIPQRRGNPTGQGATPR
jgi:type II secretory pathway pseudopilin PulG